MDNIVFTENERESIESFYHKHKNCCVKYLGKSFFSTTGGQYTFLITPTGLGNVIQVRCNVCEEVEDITDISNW